MWPCTQRFCPIIIKKFQVTSTYDTNVECQVWSFSWNLFLSYANNRHTDTHTQNHDGHIRVLQHRAEHMLLVCIQHRCTLPSPKVRCALVYSSWSSFVHICGSLNSGWYISVVFWSVALFFIWALWKSTIQLVNKGTHVDDIVWTFLYTVNVQQMPWLTLFLI